MVEIAARLETLLVVINSKTACLQRLLSDEIGVQPAFWPANHEDAARLKQGSDHDRFPVHAPKGPGLILFACTGICQPLLAETADLLPDD